MSRAEQLGQHLLLFGRPIATRELIRRIDEVDAEAVTRAAVKIVATKPTVAALGPISALESYDRIARRLS
jgi:predicted Zn-dependent peptidase